MPQSLQTILIVDDSPTDRALYRRYLSRHREETYRFLEAESGQQGLVLWQQHRPDVVLLDYGLPDLDGLSLLNQLQPQVQEFCLPVILMTGQGNEAIAVQAIKAGAQDYLVKSQLTPAGLQRAVDSAIAAVQMRTQLQQRIERSQLIAQIVQKIQQTLEMGEILQTTVTEVQQFLRSDRVLVLQLEASGAGQVVAEATTEPWPSLLAITVEDPCLAAEPARSVAATEQAAIALIERYRQGQITLHTDVEADNLAPCHRALLLQFQVRASLVVPIQQSDRCWGLLIAHQCGAPRVWQALEIDLLKELTVPLSIALRQAELYRQAQQELIERQQAEAKLQVVLAASRIRTWDWNLENHQISWFEGLENGLGLIGSQNTMTPSEFEALLYPADRKPVLAAIDRAIATGEAYTAEFRMLQPGGQLRWVLAQGKVLSDHQGRPLRLVGIDIDITERKSSEQALQQSEERYRRLFESMEDGFCVIEVLFDANNRPTDYRFLEINPAFEQQTGLQQAEGKTARELLPTLEKHWFEIYGKVALTGEPARFESGSEVMNRWFEVYAFRTGPAEHRKVALLFKDISERKANTLERERLLQQEQAARAEAERANQIKDEFLAVLSHELRSPMNPILGWVKLLQSRSFSPLKTAEALAIIERNAKLLIQLIDDLLDMAKVLRGKLSMEINTVDLALVIEAALDTVRQAALAHSVQLQAELAIVPPIAGDAARLQQVVGNLLSNAIKFTPSGGRVDVQLQQVGDQVQIIVSDTGKGIRADFLPYLFESFKQQDASTTRQYGGLGLGLAIARSLVEAHGGSIMAASAGEGQGATFTVNLPMLIQERQDSPQLAALPAQPTSLAGLRILAIDDEADARQLLTAILSECGAQVLSAASAAEGLAQLEHFCPDLLISDIGMPQMDGYSLIQAVRSRATEAGGQVPAIALTAYAGGENQQRAIASGYQRHISKPLDLDLLVQTILALVSES